jgi:hypothetical protein
MNDRRWRLTVIFAITMIAWPLLSTQAGQRVMYGWKWARGQSYDVRMVSDANTVQGQAQSLASTGFGYRLDVADVNAQGEATVNCTVTWVKIREKSGTREMLYDSADKDHPFPPESHDYWPAELLGETLSVRITRQGRVQDVGGLGIVRDNIAKKIPEGPARQQVMRGLTEQHLAKFVSNVLRPLAIYPNTPVGVGDSWDRRERVESPLYEHVTKWTLKSRRSGMAVIEADTVMTPEGPNPMSSQSHGQIEIDESTGRILHSRTTMIWSETADGSSAAGTQMTSVTTVEMTERKTGDTR